MISILELACHEVRLNTCVTLIYGSWQMVTRPPVPGSLVTSVGFSRTPSLAIRCVLEVQLPSLPQASQTIASAFVAAGPQMLTNSI